MIPKLLLKQYDVKWIGGLKDVFAHTTFYQGAINSFLIAATAYWTTVRPWLLGYIPWIKFPLFFGMIVLIILVAMLVEYKFIIPSYYKFRGRQYGQQTEETLRLLGQITDQLSLVCRRLDELEKASAKYIEQRDK